MGGRASGMAMPRCRPPAASRCPRNVAPGAPRHDSVNPPPVTSPSDRAKRRPPGRRRRPFAPLYRMPPCSGTPGEIGDPRLSVTAAEGAGGGRILAGPMREIGTTALRRAWLAGIAPWRPRAIRPDFPAPKSDRSWDAGRVYLFGDRAGRSRPPTALGAGAASGDDRPLLLRRACGGVDAVVARESAVQTAGVPGDRG